jgi:hypothetical protein
MSVCQIVYIIKRRRKSIAMNEDETDDMPDERLGWRV